MDTEVVNRLAANGSHRADMAPVPRGEPITKVEKYGWTVVDAPGGFAWVPKHELRVDPEYQRKNVSNARVLTIAAAWSWVGCGTLTVGRRPDGSKWVMDGQHRKLAADKRTDIQALPCMVFDVDGQLTEAKGFLAINVQRGAVKTLDKFDALVMAGDRVATAAKQMVEASGYQVSSNNHSAFKVKCIGTICRCVAADPDAAQVAWSVAVSLFHPHAIQDDIYEGLYYLQRHLAGLGMGSLLDPNNRDALARIGVAGLNKSIQESKAYNGGGPKACGEGIVRALNKGRRTRRIPGIYGGPADGGDETND